MIQFTAPATGSYGVVIFSWARTLTPYEFSITPSEAIFGGGFERGDVTAWSGSTP